MKHLRVKEIIAVSLLLMSLAACGGDDTKKNVSVRITSSPGTVIVGAAASFTVAAENTDFTVSATPNGSGCAKSGNTAVSCTPTAAGTYTVTVTATADASKSHNASFTVENAPVAAFALPGTCQATKEIKSSPNVPANFYGAKQLKVAVASSFYPAALEFIEVFVAGTSGTSVAVCSNSTGNFRPEVLSGEYDVFFAADETARAQFDGWVSNYPAFGYAIGIPVFAASKAHSGIQDVSGLITGGGLSGGTAKIETNNLNGIYSIASGLRAASSVGVADSTAPYGQKAHLIINAMEGTNLPDVIPSWVREPMYTTIQNVHNATRDGAVKAGFTSKGNMCDSLSTFTYVEFTHEDFAPQQTVALTSQNPLARDLYDYIGSRVKNGSWSTFLADKCFLSPK